MRKVQNKKSYETNCEMNKERRLLEKQQIELIFAQKFRGHLPWDELSVWLSWQKNKHRTFAVEHVACQVKMWILQNKLMHSRSRNYITNIARPSNIFYDIFYVSNDLFDCFNISFAIKDLHLALKMLQAMVVRSKTHCKILNRKKSLAY